MEKESKVLFISRAYPPIIGGIENQNYELSKSLPNHCELKTIINTKGKKFLPIFLPYAAIKGAFIARNCDVILLGDGVLSIVGWIIKTFTKKPVISIVHGLDLTYKLPVYQKFWVNFFIPKMNKLIAVGNTTIKEGVKRGIEQDKFIFIPNGVDTKKLIGEYTRKDLERITNMNLENKKVILTLGRLAKRKGVAWFVKNVMPELDKDILYFIAGDGADKENIKKAISQNKLEEQVKMFTDVTNEDRKALFNTVDLFVQPNIPVEGDMEGFGLVVLEAASCKRVVLASEIEGLKDAIQNGKNGILTEPKNSQKYIKKIEALLSDDELRKTFGEKAREHVKENYTWDKIAKRYCEIINKEIK